MRFGIVTGLVGLLGAVGLRPAVAQDVDVDFSYTSEDRQVGFGLHYDDDAPEIDYVEVDHDGDIEFGVFRESLAPYGAWTHRQPYGWVWSPSRVSPDWRPYTRGSWTYTDFGWTWVSDEPFGWAAYHYGRWHHDPYDGWLWVPGTRWGPAWVAWRTGTDCIGWAPLPPQVRWRGEVGLDLAGVDLDLVIRPTAWSFVEERRFISPQVHAYIVPPTRNASYLRQASFSIHYSRVGDRIMNLSVPVTRIEAVVGRRIQPTPVRVVQSSPGRTVASFEAGALNIYRPRITLQRTREPQGERRTVHGGEGLDRRSPARSRTIEQPQGDGHRRNWEAEDQEAKRSRAMRQRDDLERGRTVRDNDPGRRMAKPLDRSRAGDAKQPRSDAKRSPQDRPRQKAKPKHDHD